MAGYIWTTAMLVCALPVASVVGDYFDDYVVNINDWQRWRDPEVFLHNTLVDEVGGDGSGGEVGCAWMMCIALRSINTARLLTICTHARTHTANH